MWFPDSWKLFSKRHAKRLSRGDPLGALALARHYAEANPTDVRGWIRLGQDADRVADRVSAATAYAKAADLVPSDPWLRYRSADALVRQGQYGEARKTFETLLGEGSEGAAALAHIGLAEVDVSEEDLDAGLAHARQAESLIPEDKGDWFEELAIVVLNLPGETDWTTQLFTKAVNGGADSGSHLFLAALINDSDPYEAGRQVKLARSMWWGTSTQLDDAFRDIQQYEGLRKGRPVS
jgi:tetratricopeptide (TPR) repeat protein